MNETHDIASAQKLRAMSKPADSRQIEVPELGDMGRPAARAARGEALPQQPQRPHQAPASHQSSVSRSSHLERWRLAGPAIRELPSPTYLRGMEDLQDGFVETMIQEVAKDFELSRERAKIHDAANRRSLDIQSYIALVYAAASLVAGFLLVAREHETPGTFVLAMSGAALLIGTQPWSAFAKRPRPSPAPEAKSATKGSEATAGQEALAEGSDRPVIKHTSNVASG